MNMQKRNGMKGFTLIELLLVLAISSFIIASVMTKTIRDTQVAKAEIAGVHLKQFTVAVRQIIANEGAAVAGGPGLTQTYNGHRWLQSAAECGAPATASAEYLPCGFRGQEPFGLTYTTVVTHNNVSGTVTAEITFADPVLGAGSIEMNGVIRRDLASVVANTATRNDTFRASSTGVAGYDAYEVDAAGTIIATASLTSDLDLYIRRDGGNSPTDTIDWAGQNITNVGQANAVTMNATTITATGNMTANDLLISGKGEWASEAVSQVLLLSDGALVAKPTCPGGGTPQIFAYPVIFSRDVTAEAIGAVQAWAVNYPTQWQVRIRILTPSGFTATPPPPPAAAPATPYRRVVATVKCSR